MKIKTIIYVAIGILLSGCNLTVSPDGTRNWSINGEEAARAIIIYSTK